MKATIAPAGMAGHAARRQAPAHPPTSGRIRVKPFQIGVCEKFLKIVAKCGIKRDDRPSRAQAIGRPIGPG